MIPEIDIWRVANLMLTRYREEAMLEAAERAHELAADGDRAGNLASDHRCNRAACEHDTAADGALNAGFRRRCQSDGR
jgi:hypothetical protein